MKKYILIITIIIVGFIIYYSTINNKKEDNYALIDLSCPELNKIVDFSNDYFITNDNYLYKILIKERKCEKVSDIKINKIINNYVFSNNDTYILENDKLVKPNYYLSQFAIYDILLEEYNYVMYIEDENDSIYNVIDNNKVYEYRDGMTLIKTEEEILNLDNEKVKYFNNGYLITNKSIYEYQKEKQDENCLDHCLVNSSYKKIDLPVKNVKYYSEYYVIDDELNIYVNVNK